MGCDYYTSVDLYVYTLDNDYTSINLKHEPRYFADYDSDNEDPSDQLKEPEFKTIYKDGKWFIKNIEKYIKILKENSIKIENVKEIVKETSEDERD